MDIVAGPSRSSEHESQLEKPSCGPSSFTELKKLKMDALRGLCKSCSIPFSGRVTKQDLLELAANFFGFSTSGRHESGEGSSEKPTIPVEVRQAYKNLPSFTRIASGWSVPNLCQIPHFTLEDVHEYLLNSPDKEFDGESLRAYKQLRSYQLFDERHIHDIEINLWEKGSHFFRPCKVLAIAGHEQKCLQMYCLR